MSNPNESGVSSALQGLPPLSSLIKPEQVSKLTHFDERSKAGCLQLVSNLWEKIQNRSQDSPEYQQAYRKLFEVSNSIKMGMKKFQAEQAAQAAQVAQASQAAHVSQSAQASQTATGGQSAQTSHGAQSALPNGSRPASQGQQVPQAGTQPPVTEQFSHRVIQIVQNQNIIVPPNISQQGQEACQGWLRDAKLRFAQNWQRHENSKAKLVELAKIADTRRKEGKTFTQEEVQNLNNRKNQLQRSIHEAEDYLNKFRAQQLAFKAGNAGPSNNDISRDQAALTQVGVSNQSTQQHADHQGQPHTVSSALDAARGQTSSGNRSVMSPQNFSQQGGQPKLNQVSNSQNQGNQSQQSNSHTNVAISNSSESVPRQPAQQSNQNQTPQSATSQGPHPLSHRAAMAQTAQIYSQPNYQQSTPQPSTHAHPQMGNREHIGNRDSQNPNNAKFAIPKDLKVPQPSPVQMGPARPTLSGGPNSGGPGSLGQPAIQKHPGYVLEGEGERVLSKKKLEELVRQVTGGIGGESDEGETLSAEVEEVQTLPRVTSINNNFC